MHIIKSLFKTEFQTIKNGIRYINKKHNVKISEKRVYSWLSGKSVLKKEYQKLIYLELGLTLDEILKTLAIII